MPGPEFTGHPASGAVPAVAVTAAVPVAGSWTRNPATETVADQALAQRCPAPPISIRSAGDSNSSSDLNQEQRQHQCRRTTYPKKHIDNGLGNWRNFGADGPDTMTLLMTGAIAIYRRIPGDPLEDLALESELLARAGEGCTAMLSTSWSDPVVVLGYGQPADDADLEWCRSQGIPVLRRITGGTGVVHHCDLGFALFLPEDHPWCGSVLGLYARFLDVLTPVIERLGGPLERGEGHAPSRDDRSRICFEDRLADTLIRDGRKVVGCAQARRRSGALIHAAVPLELHAELYSRVFRVERERVAANLGPAATLHPPSEVSAALESAFVRAVGLRAERRTPPPPRREFLDRASETRWAPVPP